jgi:hypothetical protein
MIADKRIPVRKSTWMILHGMREPGQTYDELITDLIDEYIGMAENGIDTLQHYPKLDADERKELEGLMALIERVEKIERSGEFISLKEAAKQLGIKEE